MGLTRLGTWKLERKRKTGVTGSLEVKTFRTSTLEACTVQGGVPSGPGLLGALSWEKGIEQRTGVTDGQPTLNYVQPTSRCGNAN